METKLNVAGMHCGGCEESIGRALGRIEGVKAVRADHATGSVVVTLDREVDRAALAAAVEDAGYDVLPDGRDPLPMAPG